MKFNKILTLFASIIFLFAACTGEEKDNNYFGAEIDLSGDFISVANMIEDMGHEPEFKARITTDIKSVCQKKGCWMQVDKGDGSTMRVVFKDYGFFVPMEGVAFLDTTTVEMLRHYAEDANKTEEEILAITEPKIEVVFEASGVYLVEPEDN
jgi:hypothetical protein